MQHKRFHTKIHAYAIHCIGPKRENVTLVGQRRNFLATTATCHETKPSTEQMLRHSDKGSMFIRSKLSLGNKQICGLDSREVHNLERE